MQRYLFLFVAAASAIAADRFDAASVKPNTDIDSRLRMQFLPGGRFQATGATLGRLVQYAYNVHEIQVTGAQGWMNLERFDIVATSDGLHETVPPEKSQRMLQTLLAERFQLKVRREPKEMPVYALVISKSGEKVTKPGLNLPSGTGLVVLRTASISGLCSRLTIDAGRVVIDETGISGEHDIRLVFAPEKLNGGATPPELAGLTIFAAAEQQLGLKLESRRAPVETIVIERAERPTSN